MTPDQVNTDLAILTARLRASLQCDHQAVHLQLLRLLAEGNPVSIAQLTAALQLSPDAVEQVLRQFSSIEYDSEGNIVAAGLSLLPTSHQFVINGQMLSTWCALDALAYPALLQRNARVESVCPVSGQRVQLTVTPAGVTDRDPATVVVSLVIPDAAACCRDIRGTFCNYGLFFASAEAAEVWRAQHPAAEILSIDDAFHAGKILAACRYEEIVTDAGDR
jgi:alkylmercury lyase